MASQKHIRFDWALKRLLRQKANFTILEGFLSELLMFDVQIQEIIESKSNRRYEDDKSNKVDILVKNTGGELILIEVQNEKEDDYFHRMNYGQAKLLTEHINAGQRYEKIKRIYSINIVYFELGQGQDYIYIGKTDFVGMHSSDRLQLNEKQKLLYPLTEISEKYTIYYLLKVNNFDDVSQNTLDEWIYFLKNSEIKDEFRAKGLAEAKELLRVDSLPRNEKFDYEHYIESERIRDSEIVSAQRDGYFLAQKELQPILEEERKQKKIAQQREEDERKQRETAQKQKEIAIINLYQTQMQISQIAIIFQTTESEINTILVNRSIKVE